MIPERIVGYGRRRQSLAKDVIVAVDQSGSMADSIVYASLFGSVLAQLPSLRTRLVVFDTSVTDLTPVLHDPVDVLFGVQLGGGTDIAQAVGYCRQLVTRPADTVLILISDLFEGGNPDLLRARVLELTRAGVTVLCLLALSDEGAPVHDRLMAAELADLGAAVMACTPDQFPDVLAKALDSSRRRTERRHSLTASLSARMGQMVGVVERKSTTPGVVRFELNRSLSGMGHERFASVVDAIGSKPSASLARQLFATGKVDSVHVYSNIVTVDVAKGYDSSGLADIVREMYRYWKPGVEPPTFEDQPAEEATAAPRAAGAAPARGGGEGGERSSRRRPRRCPPTCSSAAGRRWRAGTPPTPSDDTKPVDGPGAPNTCSVVWCGGSATRRRSRLSRRSCLPAIAACRSTRCSPRSCPMPACSAGGSSGAVGWRRGRWRWV